MKKPNIQNQPKQKQRPNTTNLVDMPKGLTFCIVVLQKLKNKTKTYSLIDMHHQKDLKCKGEQIEMREHIDENKLNLQGTAGKLKLIAISYFFGSELDSSMNTTNHNLDH